MYRSAEKLSHSEGILYKIPHARIWLSLCFSKWDSAEGCQGFRETEVCNGGRV